MCRQQRSRKCSIVREEEDDEEGAVAGCGARPADTRRGSRSEGRLHLAARASPPSPAPAPNAATLVALPAAHHRTHLAENLTRVSVFRTFYTFNCTSRTSESYLIPFVNLGEPGRRAASSRVRRRSRSPRAATRAPHAHRV